MPVDMKKMIANAAETLLFEKKVKRLTVKDIVEECHITRQAFYYHFENIPELLKWVCEQEFEHLLEVCLEHNDFEKGLKYFLTVVMNMQENIEQGMKTNYSDEIEKLLNEYIYDFFIKMSEKSEIFNQYNDQEKEFILRYHFQAMMGILREWNDEDSQNIDQIVHMIYLISLGNLPSI